MSVKILCAMDKEAEKISVPGATVYTIGIGVNNVIKNITKLIAEGKLKSTDTIINVGYVGSNRWDIGEILTIKEVKRLNPCKQVEEDVYRLTTVCLDNITTCLTADDFIQSADAQFLNIPAVDMELYYIAAFGFKKLMAFKLVSDNLNYIGYEKFESDKTWERMNTILMEIINEQN